MWCDFDMKRRRKMKSTEKKKKNKIIRRQFVCCEYRWGSNSRCLFRIKIIHSATGVTSANPNEWFISNECVNQNWRRPRTDHCKIDNRIVRFLFGYLLFRLNSVQFGHFLCLVKIEKSVIRADWTNVLCRKRNTCQYYPLRW